MPQRSFRMSQYLQKPHNKESRQILRHAHQRSNNSPSDRQRRQPKFGCRPFQNDITGQLKQHITQKVQRQTSKILIARHFQVGRKTLDSRVGNYMSSVSVTNTMQKSTSAYHCYGPKMKAGTISTPREVISNPACASISSRRLHHRN